MLTIWRLLRCNPWSDGGVDHVPATGLRRERTETRRAFPRGVGRAPMSEADRLGTRESAAGVRPSSVGASRQTLSSGAAVAVRGYDDREICRVTFNFWSLDYIYYPVSGIMWVWHKVFGCLARPEPARSPGC